MKTLVTIVGARPQIIKASAVSRALVTAAGALREIIVHTGQHYDGKMSLDLFRELRVPLPALNLEAGSGSHALQTARMLPGLEAFFHEIRPDGVLLYGDTNSTLAGALVAARMHLPVLHVEAGLRSGEHNMPEEINRVCTDRVSTLLFAPTARALDNLGREGVPVHPSFLPSPERPAAFLTGDVMLDNQRYFLERLDETAPAQQLQGQVLATLHRETVTADPSGLRAFARALLDIAEEGIPVVLPLHPRTRNSFAALGLDHEMEALAKHPRIRLSGPLTYLELLPVLRGCSMVMTDSGGLQKEAYFLGKPVVILRERTEWEEIVASGWGVTTPIDAASILEARRRLLGAPLPGRPAFFGDGHAAEKIRDLILEYL